jgi:hypothetical protein
MPYINHSWKRVFYNGDDLRISHYRQSYGVKNLPSFILGRFEGLSYTGRWILCCNSRAHISSWLLSYLNIDQTSSATIIFTQDELVEFLDQLDYMLEVLYART